MRILVTGATGVLGRPTVARLVAAGHDVVAAVRPGGRREATPPGATTVALSLFEREAVAKAVAGADAVLHLATRIPAADAHVPDAWRENDRLRAQATEVLLREAESAGAEVFVYPSVAFVYADGGSRWLAVGSPIEPTPVLESTLVAESLVGASSLRGVALRLGGLYGPTAPLTHRALAAVAAGRSPFLGAAQAYAPVLWVDDAADALVAALHAPTGLYDVVDDEPPTRAELAAAYAEAVGAEPPAEPPAAVDGADAASARTPLAFLPRSQRVCNRAFRQATGWQPSIPSVRAAVPALAAMRGHSDESDEGGSRC